MNYLQKMIDKAVQANRTIEADELKRIQRKLDAAERTLTSMGYYWDGGEYFHPPKKVTPWGKGIEPTGDKP